MSRNNRRFSESANTQFADGGQTGIISRLHLPVAFGALFGPLSKYLRIGDTMPFFSVSCDLTTVMTWLHGWVAERCRR